METKIWKTSEIKAIAQGAIDNLNQRTAGLLQPCGMTVGDPGGDHDTEEIRVEFENGEWIAICGFHTEECLRQPDNVAVEMLQLGTSPGDSAGGIQSKVADVNLLAQAIKSALQSNGWQVVDSLDDYF